MRFIHLAALACVMAFTGVARGQVALVWQTIDGGGGTATGVFGLDTFELSGTVGQPDMQTMTGGTLTLIGGFWSDTTIPPCPADLNDDGVLDFNDYLEFLNLYNISDPQVDFNGDLVVDFNDYLEFLNLYNDGC